MHSAHTADGICHVAAASLCVFIDRCCLGSAHRLPAFQVYGVDVGYGQLADKVRRDPRVVVLERFNLRYLKPEDLGGCKVWRQQGLYVLDAISCGWSHKHHGGGDARLGMSDVLHPVAVHAALMPSLYNVPVPPSHG